MCSAFGACIVHTVADRSILSPTRAATLQSYSAPICRKMAPAAKPSSWLRSRRGDGGAEGGLRRPRPPTGRARVP